MRILREKTDWEFWPSRFRNNAIMKTKTLQSRSGFMLLMLIAFASIILGLATTFYAYCQRGISDSQIAVRIAQRQLALSTAIGKIYNNALLLNTPTPANQYATTYVGQLSVNSVKRSANLGWYRISKANAAYVLSNSAKFFNATALTQDNFLIITAGTGPSRGDRSWNNSDLWPSELRSWYILELKPSAISPIEIVKRAGALFPPDDYNNQQSNW